MNARPVTSPRRRLAAVDELPPREGRVIDVDGERIALFRCESGIRAAANACPHAGGPLADGIVCGDTVTCPLHGRVVDLLTGQVSDSEDRVTTYDLTVEDGVVYLNLPAP